MYFEHQIIRQLEIEKPRKKESTLNRGHVQEGNVWGSTDVVYN